MTWRCPKCSAPIGPHIYVNGQLVCPTDTNYSEIEKRSQ
jgi:hypothetical protein